VPAQSAHFRFEQVAAGAWAAIATDAGAAVGNAFVADLGGRSLVVDCGYTPAAARDLRGAAEELAGPVELLVITHAHFDHYAGSQAFADVPILATERTRAEIAANGPARIAGLQAEMDTYLAELEERDAPDWEQQQGQAIAAEIPGLTFTPPTEAFASDLDLGAAKVIECGTGHSSSDSVVWMPEARVLFAADLISVDTHPNLVHGDPQAWLRILDRLDALRPERVVPGHGPPAGPEAIAGARTYIETLLALAGEPGDHDLPAAFAGWKFEEVFQQNIDALRTR
jgi:cyclase